MAANTTPAPAHTIDTITGRTVRLWDDRIGVVQSAYGTASGGVDFFDVEITERPAGTNGQRFVADLGLEDVTVLDR